MANSINPYTAKQCESVVMKSIKGVTLVYETEIKSGANAGKKSKTALNFRGEDYTPADTTKKEMWRVWNNIIKTFWDTKILAAGLREKNGGIAAKLTGRTPVAITFNNGTKCHTIDLAATVWKRIGLTPTKADIEKCRKDYKKSMHEAALASFTAITTKFKFTKETEEKTEETEKTEA